MIFLSASWLAAVAQDADSCIFTMQQCVDRALENNRKAVNAKNNIEAAVQLRREAFTKYFPEISAAGMIFWANHDILQYNLLDIVELGLIHKGKVAGVQALQPVFLGGRIVNGNKLAAVGEEVAKLRQQQTSDELRLATETLYWKLATLKSTKITLESALSLLDTLQNQVEVALEAGLTTRNDLLKVQLKRNTYHAEMIDLNNGIMLVKMLLGQYMGLGVSGNLDIMAEMPEVIPVYPYEVYTPTENALPQTADYRLLQKNVEAKKLEKRMELGNNLPTIAVGAGWYYHDLLDQNHNFGSVQIGVEIPLSGWWGGSYALKRKSIELTNAKNELEDLSEKLQINMQNKWNDLTAAHRKMEIEKLGITQSAENLYLNRMYYDAGMATISDLLEAETSHKEAQDRFVTAYGNYCTALSSYMIATGR